MISTREIEESIKKITEALDKDNFPYEFLASYKISQSMITRLKNKSLNLSKIEGDVLYKNKFFFRSINDNIYNTFQAVKKDSSILRHNPRFIFITDFHRCLVEDIKTNENIDISFSELPKNYSFFLPLAKIEKHSSKGESEADIKAAEQMAKMFDELMIDNKEESISEKDFNLYYQDYFFVFLQKILVYLKKIYLVRFYGKTLKKMVLILTIFLQSFLKF